MSSDKYFYSNNDSYVETLREISDINNPEWYFKIISLRDEMTQIEDEISLCNDENNIQLLREKIRKILLEIEILEDDEEQPEDDI